MSILTDDEIHDRLSALEGWTLVDRAIRKEFTFNTFPEAMLFVNAVAQLAELLDHHPDFEIHYRHVALKFWTHTHGGVTNKDIEAVQLVEQRLRRKN